MALTADQIAQNIVNQLKILDPGVSAEIGTPERKIIEATAEIIASQQVDFTVLNQQSDLSTMSGGRLDAYLSTYNFGRQQATPSYGTVTFQRNTNSINQIVLARGTQVQANITSSSFPTLTFVTTDTVVLEIGSSSVDATVQCTVAGSVGNIDANTIVGFGGLQSTSGISSVSNAQAFTGGADQETDTAYVARFQNTFLRNISGTDDMFLALAVAEASVTTANVVGPISRYQEYVQVPATDDTAQDTQAGGYDTAGTTFPHKRTTALSTNPYSQFTYPVNDYLTDSTLDPATAVFFRPYVDYVFNTPPISAATGSTQVNTTPATQPNVTLLNAYDPSTNTGGNPLIVGGGVLLMEHAYISIHSRNNYAFGILNCVDVFINGDNEVDSSSIEVVPPASYNLQSTNAALWTYQNAGVAATDTVSASAAPSNNDTVTVNGQVYTFKTSLTGAAYEIHINGQDGSLTNLRSAINNSGGTPGTDYGTGTVANLYVTAGSVVTHAITLTAISLGTAGNAFTLAKSGANLGIGAGTFSGGINTAINFTRKLDGNAAVLGNRLQPLYWQPVTALPNTIQVGADTYYLANYWDSSNSTYYNQFDGTTYTFPAHYIFVEETNVIYGTIRCRNGIEWFLSGNNYQNGQLASDTGDTYSGVKIDTLTGSQFTLEDYFYDGHISDLQAIMEQNKQTTTDVLVHRARWRYFQPYVTLMYSFGVTQSVVNASINAALANYFETQYYGSVIQLSDILQVIHNVPGVDNVRWTNETPGSHKLQEVAQNGNALATPVWITEDFVIQDSELAASPDNDQVIIIVRAQNTFNS